MIITIFDALGIQEYLFQSNKLSDNIGASFLVNLAVEIWPLEAARNVGTLNPTDGTEFQTPGMLEGGSFDIELVYNAGGNAVFMVKDMETAKSFAQAYSLLILEYAPGLEVACCHHDIESHPVDIGKELMEAFQKMALVKSCRIPSAPLMGMGVTQLCASGMEEPAVSDNNGRFLGPSAMAKQQNNSAAKAHLRHFIGTSLPTDCDLPDELDLLGRSRGEKSFIGVVHVDGNGIGKTLQELLVNDFAFEDNQKHLEAIRILSHDINTAGSKAVRQVMAKVIDNWDHTKEKYANSFELVIKNYQMLLPFRPLVYGGDDITFVCDGRIALDLAATCIRAFNEAFSENNTHYACAGVALVKSHYPFSRAYALAEELCQNAKEMIRNVPGGALDWHIVSGGTVQTIQQLRKKEYTAYDGASLSCRPYRVLPETSRDMMDWSSFRGQLMDGRPTGLLCTLQKDEKWKKAHSRLKGLTAHLKKGVNTSRIILEKWRLDGYELPDYCTAGLSDGFFADQSPFLDALELLDFFVPLNE